MKKILTLIICLAISISICSCAKKPVSSQNENTPAQESTTPPANEGQADNSQDAEQKPDEKEKEENKSEDKPEENEETKPSEDKPANKPEDKPESKPAETTKPSESKDEPKEEPTITNTAKPSTYKEFSLTKNMSASEAYEYLNQFLSSKYSILVNKQNKVGADFVPSNLRAVAGSSYKMESTAATALENMMKAAKSAGHGDLVFYSGYRTYTSQKNKFETRTQKYINQGYSREDAEKKAGEYIAPPGSSEHNTGLAADVCSSAIVNKYGALVDQFDATSQWRWLNNHCYEYGFILRYRKNAESITGFSYEPWHFRYIGKEHAKACTEIGITYEEYYSMIVSFRDAAKAEAGV